MARALVQLGPVRSLKRLSKVRNFGRRRRAHLRAVLSHAALEDSLGRLMHTLTDTPPDNPPVTVRHPLGPDADFPAVVAQRLLTVPHLAPQATPREDFPTSHPRIVTWRQALALPSLPPRVVLIGSGYAATELALAWVGRGCQVTVISRRRHLLAGFLPHVAEAIHDEAVAAGVVVLTDAEAAAWTDRGEAVVVTADTWDGPILVVGDYVVLAE